MSARAADVVWTNIASTANGNWAVAANWRPNKVPGASDHAYITNNGTYTVSLNTTSTVAGLTLGAATGVQTLNVQGTGRLILNGPGLGETSNGVLQLTGGVLDGTGDLILSGPVLWLGGTVTGSGILQFGGVSMFKVGGDAHLSGRTLVNAGTLNWYSGTLNTGKGSVISNMLGASLVISNDVSIDTLANDRGLFLNAGIVRKVKGAANSTAGIGDVFYNTGVVEAQVGNLSFNGGGTNSGSNWVSAGASLGFGGGTNLLTSGSIVTGPGNTVFQQSLTQIDGRFTVTGTNFFKWYGKAVFRLPGLELNVLDVNGAGVEADFLTGSAVTIQTLQLTGGIVGGTDDLIMTANPLQWNGGGFLGSGYIYCHSGGAMNGGNRMDLQGRTLVNLGSFAWNDGLLYTGGGSILSNAPGATFVMNDDAGGTLFVTENPPRGTIVNAGLMRKIGTGSKMTYFNDPVINRGILEMQGGWFRCWMPYTNADGETRLFAGSTFEPRAACQVMGGALLGSGVVAGNVTNSAIVSPGLPLGQLTIDGHYSQTASGELIVDLSGAADGLYDRLQIASAGHSAKLNGRVRAVLQNGYMPLVNDVFTFLSVSGPRTGTFTSFEHPSYVALTLDYTGNSASMRVTNVAPLPLISTLSFAWRFAGEDFEGNSIWRLYPKLTWPAMVGTNYRLYHTADLNSSSWSASPDSGPPLFIPSYITATGAVMTADGPPIGTRIYQHLPPSITENMDPRHFYRLQFGP